MSKALDFSSKHHSYVVNETDSKVVRRVVRCDHCNVRGMRGDRYLCGSVVCKINNIYGDGNSIHGLKYHNIASWEVEVVA